MVDFYHIEDIDKTEIYDSEWVFEAKTSPDVGGRTFFVAAEAAGAGDVWDEVERSVRMQYGKSVSLVDIVRCGKETMSIYDSNAGRSWDAVILDWREIDNGVRFLKLRPCDGMRTSCILYPDGDYFLTEDWGGRQPDYGDIGDFDWYLNGNFEPGARAIVDGGLPRALLG